MAKWRKLPAFAAAHDVVRLQEMRGMGEYSATMPDTHQWFGSFMVFIAATVAGQSPGWIT